jgi:hypothetical protein
MRKLTIASTMSALRSPCSTKLTMFYSVALRLKRSALCRALKKDLAVLAVMPTLRIAFSQLPRGT